MTAPLILGGVYGASCVTCSAPRDHPCKTSKGEPKRTAHAARVKAAPPIVEAHVGDLVLVRYRGEHVAQLVEIGTVLSVRFWRPSAQVFASPRLLEREAVIGLAPDDARTAIACEELRLEGERRALIGAPCDIEIEGRRAAGFVTKLDEHGRPAEVEMFDVAPDIAEGRGPFDPVISHITPDEIRRLDAFGHITFDPPALPADIAEGRGPFDPGQSTSDPSLIGPFEIVSPWFTLNGAPTKAPPKGW